MGSACLGDGQADSTWDIKKRTWLGLPTTFVVLINVRLTLLRYLRMPHSFICEMNEMRSVGELYFGGRSSRPQNLSSLADLKSNRGLYEQHFGPSNSTFPATRHATPQKPLDHWILRIAFRSRTLLNWNIGNP